MNFPSPWQGAPNVSFYGAGPNFNAGAIRLDNGTSSPIAVDSVSVDLQRPGPVFSLWQNITVPANGSAILTQTSAYNFVSSGYPIVSCGGTIPSGDTRIPLVTITESGNSTTFLDTSHVLDTGGFDLSCRGNRSLAWRAIGTTGIEAPSAGITLSPDGSITETGVSATFTAQTVDAAAQPLANAGVSFTIKTGPNAGKTTATTANSQGNATFSYSSASACSDTIQASNTGSATLSASYSGNTLLSAASTSAAISVAQEDTEIVYTGATLLSTGGTQQLTAKLSDLHHGAPLANKTLSLTTGTAQIQVSFAGDANYKPSFTSAPADIAQATSFVIWGGNTGGLQLGQDVNFWGAQWASQVTGGDFNAFNANPSFKGFAQNVSAFALCEPLAATGQQSLNDQCWSSKPGNSNPPATVPTFIEVIVSTAITKSGSEIFGNIASTAILKVDSSPAYGPDPGHPGFGKIVAVIQDGANVFPTPVTLSASRFL